MPSNSALESGNPDSEDEFRKADRLKARAARFNNKLIGNRYKELEEARIQERKQYEQQGVISSGPTELGEAVDMRGTCESMCAEYEAEFREFTGEVNPLEARSDDRRRIDHNKAVAAYTRSDAGAGHGEAAKLPSDLRTPITLVKTLDYLFSAILPTQPSPLPSVSTPRTALGYTAGFIRDRTRAIRKEFAMQSSWGQTEAISSFERIARWHILCLRELQEETGMNTDMHIDSAELGRCFTSLRQHYNDRREELGVDMPCSNEPEFRAYMLIFDLTQKAVAISTAEVPSVILDHPNVQLAWKIRRAAQRNFDTQKEGSKQNAELGANLISSFVKLLKQNNVPYLLSCLVEVRLREMRRSALRALQRTYPRLRNEPIRRNEVGQVVERRMMLISTVDRILGCEEQEEEGSAWEDMEPVTKNPDAEAVDVVRRFGVDIWEDEGRAVGALLHLGGYFDDNRDAPYTRRWKSITDKKGTTTYEQIINGHAGVLMDGRIAIATSTPQKSIPGGLPALRPSAPPFQPSKPSTSTFSSPTSSSTTQIPALSQPAFSFTKPANPLPMPTPEPPQKKTFSFDFAKPTAPSPPSSSQPPERPKEKSKVAFDFGNSAVAPSSFPTPIDNVKPPSEAPILTFTPATSTPSSSSILEQDKDPLQRPTFLNKSPKPEIPSAELRPPNTTPDTQSTSPSPLSQSISSPRKVSLRSSLTKNVSRSLSSSQRSNSRQATEKTRFERLEQIPHVADMILEEVIQSFLSEIKDDLDRVIKSQNAAKVYLEAKKQRRHFINQASTQIFQMLVDGHTEELCEDVIGWEMRRRKKKRYSDRYERELTRERKMFTHELEKEREDVWERLRVMGLGGKSEGSVMRESQVESERMQEVEIDAALHEAERVKEHFYSPSSFLHSLARHTSPILTSTIPSNKRLFFKALISTASESASPAPKDATDWLANKLKARSLGGEWWECEGVDYATDVVGRYDVPKDVGSTGLMIFEIPLATQSTKARDQDIADCQDRLVSLLKVCQQNSVAYNPALLLVTWQDEQLASIRDRLNIGEFLDQFSAVQLVNLSTVEDIDLRFRSTIEHLIKPDVVREQLDIPLRVISSGPIFQRLLESMSMSLHSQRMSGSLVRTCFINGIEAINKVSQLIKEWPRKIAISGISTFDPITLPAFTVPSHSDVSDVINAVESYLEDPLFDDLHDVELWGRTLHSAHSRKLSLPVPQLLAAIAAFVFGEWATQHLILKLYGNREYINQKQIDFFNEIMEKYSNYVEGSIEKINLLALPASPGEESAAVINSDRPKGDSVTTPMKRRMLESPEKERESKSLKNQRLADIMRKVERTLEEIDNNALVDGDHEEWVGINQVGERILGVSGVLNLSEQFV